MASFRDPLLEGHQDDPIGFWCSSGVLLESLWCPSALSSTVCRSGTSGSCISLQSYEVPDINSELLLDPNSVFVHSEPRSLKLSVLINQKTSATQNFIPKSVPGRPAINA